MTSRRRGAGAPSLLLLLLTACSPSWTPLRQAEPSPFSRGASYAVLPSDFADVELDEGDAVAFDDGFTQGVGSGARLASSGEEPSFVIRAKPTHYESGASGRTGELVVVVALEDDSGNLLDVVRLESRLGGILTTEARAAIHGRVIGEGVADYLEARER